MEANKNILVHASQCKKTILDRAYNKHIATILTSFDEELEERWETYNLILNSLETKNYLNEIKYRVTDGEDLNEIFLDIINRNVLEVNGLVWLLKRRIEEYIEEDFLKRFYM